MPVIHLEELRTERHGGKCGEGKRRAAGKTMDGTQGSLLYAINRKGKHQYSGVWERRTSRHGNCKRDIEKVGPAAHFPGKPAPARYNRPPLGREML
jgi:hypothetical protein